MWNCDPNIIVIGSIDNDEGKVFEKIDIRENIWNDYMINNNKSFDELFGITIKTVFDSDAHILFPQNVH